VERWRLPSSTDSFPRPILSVPIPESLIDQRYPHQKIVSRVIIRHPAYSDHNELLSFNAWDHGHSGVHLGTVLLACQLVACNEFNGFLTKDRNGSERITGPVLGAQRDTISRIYIEYKQSAKYKERKEKRKRERRAG
jgi:hypothetical protein